ncbi:serine/threonine protein kinase [Antrihabitans sp. YC3-6]|uniref:Serine/threonine protein kinase n=1 Tax=Antrihabitans stalagmiti TaxID=2799499 RepID=A0A934NM00_9NOCA|nr:serine/threonine-protein kinase [Antrihabitans stalagmiti]MBJ8337669.1 serine/threonine protein kinase [Antrihabitans stalagmiti]
MRPLAAADPSRIGDYRLLGVLGSGGMGTVYLGRNSRGRTLAVKVVRPELSHDPSFRMRFQREVTAARRVAGPYTAPVLDADVNAERPWLATGYVAGLSLNEAVELYGPLPERSLHVLADGLARALITVHDAGIVHRDLKPSNVLLTSEGPKVIDFGIARAAEDSVLTTTGEVIGSPNFMCPEQVTGGATLGPAGDVFSLGGVLVYAATGHGPFGEGSVVAMLWRVVQEDPDLTGVPSSLLPIISACLDKEPARRPTPRQLLDQLANFGRTDTVGWLPRPVLEHISSRAVALLELEDSHDDNIEQPTQQWRPDERQATAQQPVPVAAPKPRRARRAVGGFVAVVVLLALFAGVMVLTLTLMDRRNDPANDASTSSGTTAVETTEPTTSSEPTTTTPAAAALPDAYVGTWTGSANDGPIPFEIVVSLTEGTVGDEVATSSNTGGLTRTKCERIDTLIEVTSATDISLRSRLAPGTNSGCMDDGTVSTLQLLPDGSMRYSTTGVLGQITGTLRKQ